MKKIKNKTMGFIPSTQDRSVYQRRQEYIASLGPIALAVVSDFENSFVGNLVNGYKFSEVLKSFIIDYQAFLLNKSLNLMYWFNIAPAITIYGSGVSAYTPTQFNSLFPQDLKYKTLLRSDGKLAPFNYCINGLNFNSLNLIRSFIDKTIYPHTDYANWMGMVFTSLLNVNNSIGTSLSVAGLSGAVSKRLSYEVTLVGALITTANNGSFNLTLASNFQSNNTFSVYIGNNGSKFFYVYGVIDPSRGDQTYKFVGQNGMSAEVTIVNSASSAPTMTVKSITLPSYNFLLSELNDALALIQWLESESVALNIEGNYDGIKTDAFEQLLNDQLDFLNTMTDRVENSLIGSKLDGQKQKDAVQAQIDARRVDLQNVIAQKKADIKSMNDASVKFQSLIKNRIII